MLVKFGVDISRLQRPMRRALKPIEKVFKSFTGLEAVLSSTYEGDHGVDSLHYADLACDFSWPIFIRTNKSVLLFTLADRKKLVNALKQTLGSAYDVILELTHIHIEYDPKGV